MLQFQQELKKKKVDFSNVGPPPSPVGKYSPRPQRKGAVRIDPERISMVFEALGNPGYKAKVGKQKPRNLGILDLHKNQDTASYSDDLNSAHTLSKLTHSKIPKSETAPNFRNVPRDMKHKPRHTMVQKPKATSTKIQIKPKFTIESPTGSKVSISNSVKSVVPSENHVFKNTHTKPVLDLQRSQTVPNELHHGDLNGETDPMLAEYRRSNSFKNRAILRRGSLIPS